MDPGRTPLSVPPSSRTQSGSAGQSPPLSTPPLEPIWFGPNLLARAPTTHGTRADPHYHALLFRSLPKMYGASNACAVRTDRLSVPRSMTPRSQHNLPRTRETFAAQIQALRVPIDIIGVAANRFLAYLQIDFPTSNLSDLRRDPHLLGGFAAWAKNHLCPLHTSHLSYSPSPPAPRLP